MIGLEALFLGTLSPGGNARDDDGDFANMQGVGLSPPFVDRRSPEEKKAAAERKIKREAKKAVRILQLQQLAHSPLDRSASVSGLLR